jgi:hypothetical protein
MILLNQDELTIFKLDSFFKVIDALKELKNSGF